MVGSTTRSNQPHPNAGALTYAGRSPAPPPRPHHELRQGLLTDARIYLHDVDQLRVVNQQQIEDLTTRVQQLKLALSRHQKLGPPAYRPVPPTNTVRLGNFSAAKASGLAQLLSEDEINSVGDAEVGVAKSEALKEQTQEATRKRLAFEQRFQTSNAQGSFDFSPATPLQLDQYLDLLLEEQVLRAEYLDYLGKMHGGAEAYLRGERDVEKLRQAEDAEAPR